MRVPRAKVWRAFREFDPMSDEECLRCLRHTILNAPPRMGLVPYACALAGISLMAALNLATDLPSHAARIAARDPVGQAVVEVGAWVIGAVAAGALAGLVGRDVLYYFCLRRALRRTDCRGCGQSLLGVPIIDTSLHGEPGKARVRCPECGRLWLLLDLGLTPRDMIPLEMRAASADIGRPRRRHGVGRRTG